MNNDNIEYFEPINRKAEKLKTGDGLQSKIYKKVTRAKKSVVGSSEDNFDQFGQRIFYGNV